MKFGKHGGSRARGVLAFLGFEKISGGWVLKLRGWAGIACAISPQPPTIEQAFVNPVSVLCPLSGSPAVPSTTRAAALPSRLSRPRSHSPSPAPLTSPYAPLLTRCDASTVPLRQSATPAPSVFAARARSTCLAALTLSHYMPASPHLALCKPFITFWLRSAVLRLSHRLMPASVDPAAHRGHAREGTSHDITY